MKKRTVINIILIAFVIVGIFFLVRYDVMGKLYDVISRQVAQNKSESKNSDVQGELIYETVLDEDGNEIVIELEKILMEDEEGNEVEMYVDTSEPTVIYDHTYKGKITKIQDNKIYFNVDQEVKEGTDHIFENVKDYEIIFNINTYNIEFDPNDASYLVNDCLVYEYESFYKAEDLRSIMGKYLRVNDTLFEDYYTGKEYKSLIFYNQ